MHEPRNLAAINRWIAQNRPDCSALIDMLLKTDRKDAFILMMTMSFEAGRMFQANEVADPARYVPMEEEY